MNPRCSAGLRTTSTVVRRIVFAQSRSRPANPGVGAAHHASSWPSAFHHHVGARVQRLDRHVGMAVRRGAHHDEVGAVEGPAGRATDRDTGTLSSAAACVDAAGSTSTTTTSSMSGLATSAGRCTRRAIHPARTTTARRLNCGFRTRRRTRCGTRGRSCRHTSGRRARSLGRAGQARRTTWRCDGRGGSRSWQVPVVRGAR